MTNSPKVEALIAAWNTGKDVTVKDLINLNAAEREEFFSFLSPVNERNARKAVAEFING